MIESIERCDACGKKCEQGNPWDEGYFIQNYVQWDKREYRAPSNYISYSQKKDVCEDCAEKLDNILKNFFKKSEASS